MLAFSLAQTCMEHSWPVDHVFLLRQWGGRTAMAGLH